MGWAAEKNEAVAPDGYEIPLPEARVYERGVGGGCGGGLPRGAMYPLGV